MHAVLHRIKSLCSVSVWIAATVPTGVTDPASSGLGRAEITLVVKEFLWALLVLW